MNENELHILSAPRSASTIIAAALAQHPSLFLCPEVNFWSYSSLEEMLEHDEREYSRTGLKNTVTAGLVRVIVEIDTRLANPEAGMSWLLAHARWSLTDMTEYIADRLAPRRPLYKSTRLALSPTGMQRLAAWPGNIKLVHLIRHPISVIDSLIRIDPVRGNIDLHAMTWICANRNISGLWACLPRGSGLLVRSENVLIAPAEKLKEIAIFAGLEVTVPAMSAMMEPQRSPFAMPIATPPDWYLDPGFIDNPHFRRLPDVEPNVETILGAMTRSTKNKLESMAASYGYDLKHPHS